jgi:hypothetical protein
MRAGDGPTVRNLIGVTRPEVSTKTGMPSDQMDNPG